MRRVSVVALLIVLAVAGSCAVVSLSPGVALAQAKPAETPMDIFITPVFWVPFQSDFHAYGSRDEIARWTPQGGLQLGLRYGNFSLGVSGLWMSWTDRLTNNTPGEEFSGDIHVDRYDVDISAIYTFRDVIANRLSISTGVSYFTAHVYSDFTCDNGCVGDPQTRESQRTNFWGLGPNLGATLRLADRWYLSASTANVWGEANNSTPVRGQGNANTSAFLNRNDVTVRFLLSDTVSLFTGYKTQLVSAPGIHDRFWHGPIFGLTVRYNLQ